MMEIDSVWRIRYRPALRGDLNDCLKLLPPWLHLDPGLRRSLPALWADLLYEPSFNAIVIEDLDAPAGDRLVAAGMVIVLDDQWHERLASAPPPHLAAHIYGELNSGAFVPPSDRALGRMNAAGNVTALTLHYVQKSYDVDSPQALQLWSAGMNAFRHIHDGYRLRKVYHEGCGTELEYMAAMGWKVLTRRAERARRVTGHPGYPELCGLSCAEAACSLPGTPVRDAFQFTPPVIGFTASERRLLRLAIYDLPDEQIAEELGITGHTVKTAWRSIHRRVTARLPGIYDARIGTCGSEISGRERRRMLLPYLRQHREELYPYNPGSVRSTD